MTKQTKPRYELKRRSKNYVGLYEGDHCLCAICTNKTCGVLDAQLILLVMNSQGDLVKAGKNILGVFVGHVEGSIGGQAIELMAAAIEKTKPKAEKEAEK